MRKNRRLMILKSRLESLIQDVENSRRVKEDFNYLRYKPFYETYNSCIKEFRSHLPSECEKLNLEELPLYDADGKERFTNTYVSTLVRQSKEALAVLLGLAKYTEYPGEITVPWLLRSMTISTWLFLIILLFLFFVLGVLLADKQWVRDSLEMIKKLKEFLP